MALFSPLKKVKKSLINPFASRNVRIKMRLENPKETYDLFKAYLPEYPDKVRPEKFRFFR